MSRRRRPPSLALQSEVVQDCVPIEIIPNLWVGSQYAAFNSEANQNRNITHIINASGRPATYPDQFTYMCLQLKDREDADLLSCIPRSNEFLANALAQNRGALVHCQGGRSRSPALVVAYLMHAHNVGFQEGMALCKRLRAVVAINPGFQSQLQAYEAANCDAVAARLLLPDWHPQSCKKQGLGSNSFTPRRKAKKNGTEVNGSCGFNNSSNGSSSNSNSSNNITTSNGRVGVNFVPQNISSNSSNLHNSNSNSTVPPPYQIGATSLTPRSSTSINAARLAQDDVVISDVVIESSDDEEDVDVLGLSTMSNSETSFSVSVGTDYASSQSHSTTDMDLVSSRCRNPPTGSAPPTLNANVNGKFTYAVSPQQQQRCPTSPSIPSLRENESATKRSSRDLLPPLSPPLGRNLRAVSPRVNYISSVSTGSQSPNLRPNLFQPSPRAAAVGVSNLTMPSEQVGSLSPHRINRPPSSSGGKTNSRRFAF